MNATGPVTRACRHLTAAEPAEGLTSAVMVADLRRFGQPSNFSLPAAELAAHVRQLRRSGWQAWELRERFTFGRAA